MDKIKKINANVFFFFITYTIYILSKMLKTIDVVGDVLDYISDITLFCLIINFVINIRKIEKKHLIIIILTFVVLCISAFVSNNRRLLFLFLFLIAIKDIEFDKVVKYDLFLKIFCMIIAVSAFYLGFANGGSTHTRGEIIRYPMGFGHPNVFAQYFIAIIFELTYLCRNKINILNVVIIIVGFAIVDYFSDSRTAMIGLILLLIAIFFFKRDKIFKNVVVKAVLSNLFLILTVLTLIFTFLYANENEVAIDVDHLTSGRARYSTETLETYQINLFGNKIEIDKEEEGHLIIDNAYILLLVNYGVLACLIIYLLYRNGIKHYIDANENVLVAILIIFVIMGLMEKYMFYVEFNVFLLSFSYMFFGKHEENKKEQIEK